MDNSFHIPHNAEESGNVPRLNKKGSPQMDYPNAMKETSKVWAAPQIGFTAPVTTTIFGFVIRIKLRIIRFQF
jgi:hypothetical protein